jgi:biotin-dependent carboxylase-like uncharacterized protein
VTRAGLLIRAAGPGVTIQDAGRFGYARYGVTPAGPMDPGAFAAATGAVGANAAIEVSLGGLSLESLDIPLAIAIAGGGFDIRLDGQSLPAACLLALTPGKTLTIRAGGWGAWCYLAFGGRFDLPLTLGALATHARSGLGPAPLAAGDRLTILDPSPAPDAACALQAPWLAPDAAPIRVMPGPQDDYFSPQAMARFLQTPWRLGARSDRMAYALEGPPIDHALGHDIVSDGAAMGAIQIPGSGAPFVLMADRQPTGGYPKIATVIGADLGRLAQKRPGETIHFQASNYEAAVATRRAYMAALAQGPQRTALAGDMTTEALLAGNLVGGVISAMDEPQR